MLKAGTAARRRTLTGGTIYEPTALQSLVVDVLGRIDGLLQQTKADWVGHIKVLIGDGNVAMYGSVTMAGDAPTWAGQLTAGLERAELTIYAAIYTLTDAQVAAAVDEALAEQSL